MKWENGGQACTILRVGRIRSIQVQASLVVDRLRAARALAFQVSTGSM
jgi:hypothetical protein